MEIRSFGESAAPKLLDERNIEGYAIVFERESRVMYDLEKKRFFIEIIKSGAVSEELLRSCDVKALLEHNKQRLLARSNNGTGSLSLCLDDYGCMYRFASPNTQDGNYAIEMIQRGDLFGSSFAYITDEKRNVEYSQRDGLLIRTVTKIDKIFDVSIVSDPAYFGTDVTLRSLEIHLQPAKSDNYQIEIEKLRTQI